MGRNAGAWSFRHFKDSVYGLWIRVFLRIICCLYGMLS